MENKNWPDAVRLKMIERSEFYQDPKIYQYGYYDGYQSLTARIEELEKALGEIADWKLPETGKFWDRDEEDPMSYEAAYGSNGARDYIKSIAQTALIKQP